MAKTADSGGHALVCRACASPDKLVIWTGAGTSYESGLPLGDRLTEAVLEQVFNVLEEEVPDRIKSLYRHVFRDGSRTVPRLEFLLDRVSVVLGEKSLAGVLKLFGCATPNRAHVWLAKMANRGAKIITSNFDTLIEDAGAPRGRVVHYHGTFDDVSTCGATLRRIARGFSKEQAAQIHALLVQADDVLFLGHSGRDYYDVVPFFVAKAETYRSSIWLLYKQDLCAFQDVGKPPDRLRYVETAFKASQFVEGDPAAMYDNSYVPPPFDWEGIVAESFRQAGIARRHLLALDVIVRMGLDELAMELLNEVGSREELVSWSPGDRTQLQRTELRVLLQSCKFQQVDRRLKQLRAARSDMESTFRRYEAELACWSFALRRYPTALWRSLRALRGLRNDPLAFVSCRMAGQNALERIWAVHEELQFFYHVVSGLLSVAAMLSPHLAGLFAAPVDSYRAAQASLARTYDRLVDAAEAEYDEVLAQSIRSEAQIGPTETAGSDELPTRWLETDNLREEVIERRKQIRAAISGGVQPSPIELERGISQSREIGDWFELILWLANADRYRPQDRQRWAGLRKEALSHIELNRIKKELLLLRARLLAATGL